MGDFAVDSAIGRSARWVIAIAISRLPDGREILALPRRYAIFPTAAVFGFCLARFPAHASFNGSCRFRDDTDKIRIRGVLFYALS